MYKKYIKRILDIFLSGSAIIVLSPLLLVLAILVRVKLGFPVIFKQKRPGYHERIFTLYKFRSMTNKADHDGKLLSDEVRLTRFGRIIRSTSLDELPELWNILKGDMSFIGPRPLLVKYLDLYSAEQHHRHDVRPGLTGYAQAYGRNALSWNDKFSHDLFYVNNVSFILDLKIFLKTIEVVAKREGISAQNSETMEEFKG